MRKFRRVSLGRREGFATGWDSQDLHRESDDDENDGETGENPLLQDDHHREKNDLGDCEKGRTTRHEKGRDAGRD